MLQLQIRPLSASGFLLFSLMAQEVVVTLFAVYSCVHDETRLAIFYLTLAVILVVALSIFYIFKQHSLSRLLLLSALLGGFFFLLIDASDPSTLMWCLTVVPVLTGSFNNRQGPVVLTVVFISAVWILSGAVSPSASHEYSGLAIISFLSCYVVLAVFTLVMNSSLRNDLDEYQDLSYKADQLAYRDTLTQLPNRRYMEEQLQLRGKKYAVQAKGTSVSQAHRQSTHQLFSILLITVDHFKLINDRYGHDLGDQVLCTTSQMLRQQLRDEDIVARWGSTEFMILLPSTNGQASVNIANRLRSAASAIPIDAQGDQLTITLSMGVASIDGCMSIDDLLHSAENGLYQAKQMGRDMVVSG